MKRGRWGRWAVGSAVGVVGVALLASLAVCGLSGCSGLGYYWQSTRGHLDLMQRATPLAQVLADPAAEAGLRQRLALAQAMRRFAVDELKLPDNASYTRYADLQRNAVVWNVVATPELSLQLKTWCFPVVGCVGYRGYFERDRAQATADALQAEAWEVRVYGVPAYSTLGWMNWAGGDPLLNTFIFWPEGELARLLFHELAHQVVYAQDDTAFNEAFATAVEKLGVERWLARHGNAQQRAQYEAIDQRRRDFKALTQRARDRLATLYSGPGSDEQKRQAKAQAFAQLRLEYDALKSSPAWAGFKGYDGWMDSVNNAALALQAAYDEGVPAFERLFERQGRDFDRFYAEVKRLAGLPKAERAATLAQ